jgi:nucleoside-diphosphate-sugar epimerase
MSAPADGNLSTDRGTVGPGDQGTRGPRDQGTKGPKDQRTKGPKDQGAKGPKDKGTEGPKDRRTEGPSGNPAGSPSTTDASRRLVIFGCGYVGTAVALQALARGLEVTALTRNVASAAVLREQGVGTVVADLADSGWHDAVPGGVEFALNCVSPGSSGLEGYRRSYVAGMQAIVAWARRHGPIGTLVYTSSTSVYPQSDGACVDETAPTAGAGERGALLLESERVLGAAGDACRRWFVLRLAGIYGPGRHHLLDQVRAGEIAGVGEHRLNLAHRDDIAAAIWRCFDAPAAVRNEVFNVADDEPARKAEVVAWLAARLAVPSPSFTGEPGARRPLTPDRVIMNRKLKTTLGWRPRYPTFRAGYESLLSR